jgi:hypothetical protein
MRTYLLFLILACQLLNGCHTTDGPPPVVQTKPDPPGVIKEKIHVRQNELDELMKSQPSTSGKTKQQYEDEIKQREDRIQYLRGEIEALLNSLPVSIQYYQKHGEAK